MAPSRSPLARLDDIRQAIAWIEEMTAGRTLADYVADHTLRLAVERAVEIVSEASRHVPAEWKARFPDTPWAAIAAIGNRLRHEYERADPTILWGLAQTGVGELRPVIDTMIEWARALDENA